jgi:tetratricopeptide (TPR) repeat protein
METGITPMQRVVRSFVMGVAVYVVAMQAGNVAVGQTVDVTSRQTVRALLPAVKSTPVEAAKKLSELMRSKPTDPVVLEGIGTAFLQMDRYDLAKPALEAALTASKNNPSRDLVFNLAVLDMKQKANVMRSVKLVSTYMQRPDALPDEPLQNLYGSLLMTAAKNKISRAAPLFQQAVTVYLAHDARLEQERTDGSKRWGDQWMAAKEKDILDKKRSRLIAEIDAAAKEYSAADDRLESIRKQLNRISGISDPYGRNRNVIARLRDEASEAQSEVAKAKATLASLRQQLPRPAWAAAHEPIVPVAIASADEPAIASAKPTADQPIAETPLAVADPVDPPAVEPEPAMVTDPEPVATATPPAPPRRTKPAPIARIPAKPTGNTGFGSSIFDFGE